MTVGRLSPEKGHRDLIAAIAELKRRKEPPDFRMLILGAGPELDRLQGIARVGSNRSRHFRRDNRRCRAVLLVRPDIFILPPFRGIRPMRYSKAMIGGTPVVATSVGGVPEIGRVRGSRLLVPAGTSMRGRSHCGIDA